ncbi:MAG TPA: ABC transporter permease [Acidimicrobiales bacterium]|nr:ABC transporter permease [Acidimicrobiales bacterium]
MITADDPAPTPHAPRPLTVDLHHEQTSPREWARELWKTRALVAVLTRKEFHTRYRRVSFGILWALILPFMQATIIVVVLSHVIKLHSGTHYGVFVLSGVVPWAFFTSAFSAGATAIVDNVGLASRVYFPRVVLVIVQVAQALYALGISLVIVLVLSPVLGVAPTFRVLLIVPASLLLIGVILSMCMILSALHVYFRDIRYLVGAAMLVWFYVTPIIYPLSVAPKAIRPLININPVTGPIDLFRYAFVGPQADLGVAVVVSLIWTAVCFTIGVYLQARRDRVFADRL